MSMSPDSYFRSLEWNKEMAPVLKEREAAAKMKAERDAAIAALKGGGGSSGGGSGSSVSSSQRKALANAANVAKYNARTLTDQYKAKIAGFDLAEKQAKRQAKVQKQQNSRTAASDRFAQLQRTQSSASALTNKAGNALQGSQAYGMFDMLSKRNNMDNSESWNTLRENQDSVTNSLNETLNANNVARNEAAWLTEAELRKLEADMAAQSNNINPKLYAKPGKGAANFKSKNFAKKRQNKARKISLSGYMTNPPQLTRNNTEATNTGSSYFDQLTGGYGG